MGIRAETLDFFWSGFKAGHVEPTEGFRPRMCELGNQHIRPTGMDWAEKRGLPKTKISKILFEAAGFTHVSIDFNGQDGALPLDLREQIKDEDLLGSFDVVTNSGTSEHVGNQQACFDNIRQLCKPGGIMIHVNPLEGNWKGHCPFAYRQNFFNNLATCMGDTILRSEILNYVGPKNLLLAAIIRKEGPSIQIFNDIWTIIEQDIRKV